MQLATTSNIADKLLDVLGLKGQSVTSIVIRVDVNSVVEVDVTRHIGFDEFQQVIHEFTPYKLAPKD